MRDRLGRAIDTTSLVGQNFGLWTVTAFAGLYKTKHQNITLWCVRCACGREKRLNRQILTSGASKSCGCNSGLVRRAVAQRERARDILKTGTKKCSHKNCTQNNPQPLSEFYPHKHTLDGYSSWCSSCQRHRNAGFNAKQLGISQEAKRILFEKQNGKCANRECRRELRTFQKANLDHDHITMAIRGLLCAQCNMALGLLQDSLDKIRGLHQYLETHKQNEGIVCV